MHDIYLPAYQPAYTVAARSLPLRCNLDVATLTDLLREAEAHHGQYEPTAPKHHWSQWYAAYIVAREEGKAPDAAAEAGRLSVERTRQ